MLLRHLLTLFLIATTLPSLAAELKTTPAGIEVVAGSLGNFVLTYPEFVNASSQPVHKQTQASASGGTATVQYEGGAQCTMTVAKDEITLTFSQIPADVASWKVTTLIDIGFAKGGTWKVGETAGTFPAEKPKTPQIASLGSTTFQVKNAQGQSLDITTPDFAFQQLTDNREWNWAVYHWMCLVPYLPDSPTATFKITTELAASAKLVDAFGQSIKDAFPNKLLNESDLKADVAADEAYYTGLKPPATDKFGGLPGSGEKLSLKATGFFHVEAKGGKTWLVDPEGQAFFHLGICGFAPNDDYTYIKGRESIYEWLPSPQSEFTSAFRPGDDHAHFSFYLANTIKKFGAPYDLDTHAARMIPRVRQWGFNSIGAFSPKPPTACEKASFPYVAHLPINEWEGLPRIPGAHEVWDPYEPATEAKIAENLARELPAHAQDPLLIGYFIVNEPRYDELPRVIPSLTGKHACKRELVAFLKKKHATIDAYNQAWQSQAASFESLLDAGLAVSTDQAKADVRAFMAEFLETYFAQIERLYRRHDRNHLLLGSRLQPITIQDETLCRIMGRHVDVVSYNYYTYGVDKAELSRIHEWSGGRPMMLSEFFWSSPKDSGLIGGREVSSQRERGLAYRNYVEQSAVLGFVVGIEWFTLVDQATTGRWFSKYNGESYNTGLISVADRPWKDMLEEMMKTNYAIYDLLLGQKKPFQWDDSRFAVPTKAP
ncbi:hypothetical protein [Prosthecobacter dejongeii]|uniref:Glycoside hydrolase family 42 N-terminal domain-containing protein n=1 Tax=Prosthecobacter dejongeii TaxID=48465 RepID=A0A7W7YMX4_9BACT|nr:hypothetical protein [Prosthecobacter dejongeii]MBB5039084.1 hypothetical protein [Prosthecobacter dejongeii]